MAQKELVIFESEDKAVSLSVPFEEDTVWLNQSQMIELFERNQSVISRHIKNVFEEGEVDEKSNMHFLHNAFSDKPVAYYSLDAVLGGVKSPRFCQPSFFSLKNNPTIVIAVPAAPSKVNCSPSTKKAKIKVTIGIKYKPQLTFTVPIMSHALLQVVKQRPLAKTPKKIMLAQFRILEKRAAFTLGSTKK